MSRLGQSRFSRLVAPRRSFKLEGVMNEKYILYARKSTDVEDKQVLSIEAQLVELRAYARNENLQIIDELSRKEICQNVPGRPSLCRSVETN
jgi:DNA invertase Pin-like site-specific DNA recombinase